MGNSYNSFIRNLYYIARRLFNLFTMEIKNAVILPVITPNTLEFGGLDPYGSSVIFPNGSLIKYLPEFETQANTYFDTWGCVSHSFENGVEALINTIDNKWLKDNIYINGQPNFSDRDLIILSGTIAKVGNSGQKVLDTAREKGLVSQILADWDSESRDPDVNIQEVYYKYTRNQFSEKFAEDFNERLEITGTWVHRNNWEQASKEGALQVYVKAWHKNSEGLYYNPSNTHNHAVLMADYKYKKIYDTYKPEIKELTSWDDAYEWALKINITEKTMSKPTIENNTLIQLVEGTGGFGLYLDDKIFVDDLSKILASWLVRNNGKLDGKTRALTLKDWNAFSKVNLKGEVV